MLPIPAIDLKEGQCVRLKQGRMTEATIFSDNPVAMAGQWIEQGATRLHLVDLDGAFAGSPRNGDAIAAIAKHYPNIPIQIGGGIRDEQTARHYFDLGVAYCIIGSKAVAEPEFVIELANKFPKQIIVGIDAKDGMVATDGWANVSTVSAVDLAQRFANSAVAAIVYTDIAKDGMMAGVNVKQTATMAKAVDIPVIASGGVASLDDIVALKQADAPIFGAIIGRALYDNAFSLADAYRIAAQ